MTPAHEDNGGAWMQRQYDDDDEQLEAEFAEVEQAVAGCMAALVLGLVVAAITAAATLVATQ